MKGIKRFAGLVLVIAILTQLMGLDYVYAAIDVPDRPTIVVEGDLKPATGYSREDGYYVDLNWGAVGLPTGLPWDNVYYNVYIQEIDKQGKASGYSLKEQDLTGTSVRIRSLKSGTIYNFYVTAFARRTEGTNTYVSNPSIPSNIVTVLTNIEIYAYPDGNKQIIIQWDDVWNSGSRIGYNLYIADDSSFSNAQPIYISPSQIGSDSRITVNQAAGKLEYRHTVGDSGRVYYVKIAPVITGTEVFYNSMSKTVAASSYILVKTTKISTSDSGTVWRLDWSEVAVAFEDLKITYQLYKVNPKVNNLPQYMLSVDDNSTYITVPAEEAENYYIIRALVTDVYGNDIYAEWGVKIQSDNIYLRDMEVPTIPASPELVDRLNTEAGDAFITYEGQLKPNSATLLWELPRKGDGEIDYDISYDMWIITDPNKIDTPDASNLIAENVKVEDTLVIDGTEILGCKYVVGNLVPNSTYYYKIVAKKTYLEYVEGDLEEIINVSVPAYKVVITPPEGSIETPLVPGTPPLKIKKSADGEDIITDTTATIQIKNKWYEKYNEEATPPAWEYIEPVIEVNDGVQTFFPNDEIVEDESYAKTYRKVEYDEGITIDIGCIEFVEGMNYNELKDSAKYPANKMTGVQITANDADENPALNPDGKKHNVDIQLDDLKPNTTYVIWARANRASAGLVSGPSDPIVITTGPGTEIIPEKPVVPFFNYSYAADVYIELGWEFKTDYKYYIKYSKNPYIDTAEGSAEITGEELSENGLLTISGLSPDTMYYFWLQAEAVVGETAIKSDWSDSYAVKTKADIPPATPRGFGIKNTSDAVTKNSITYEWMQETGLEYILEISDNIDYEDAEQINVGSVSEYKVEGLTSNKRYYARLYAYDAAKDLKSLPTQSVIAKTLRSADDYDSDEDIDNVISGDYVVKDKTAPNFTWNIKIVGVNADRFIQHIQTDGELEYFLDASKPPATTKKIVLTISSKVFRVLANLKETFVVVTETQRITVRPGVFSTDMDTQLMKKMGDFDYQITIASPDESMGQRDKYLSYKTPVTSISVGVVDGNGLINVDAFDTPLKLSFKYSELDWYREGVTSGYKYESAVKGWEKAATQSSFDEEFLVGYASFEIQKPGSTAIAEAKGKYFDDITGHWAESSINKVAGAKQLKSISGRTFKPDAYVTVADTVKLVFDVDGYNYDTKFMAAAVKSGLVSSADASASGSYCSREKAIAMIIRLYEIKTGEKASPESRGFEVFNDMYQVSDSLLQKVEFAVENGIALGRSSDMLGPKDSITRAELLTMLEKYLAMIGEID